MGRFSVEIELANYRDMMHVDDGTLAPEKVRRTTIRGIVDSGATRLVLPQSVVKQLGLHHAGEGGVRYADGRRVIRPRVMDVWVELLGRGASFNAIVEPRRKEALIGAIVLEDLDLLVDCTAQRLHPRDPKWIISEE